jgi:ribosome-associated protein
VAYPISYSQLEEIMRERGVTVDFAQKTVIQSLIMLRISSNISIPLTEIVIQAIHAQGSGGQNVNKVATAVHLRFDIKASSLSEIYKERLLNLKDSRITTEGVVIIKAQRYSSQIKNREDALNRLREIIKGVTVQIKLRKPTKPTKASKIKRLEHKAIQSQRKSLRGKVEKEN